MKTIVVALDFSDVTAIVLRHACELAATFGSELHLLHTTDPGPNYAMYGFSPAEFPISPFDDKLRAAVRSRLDELAAGTGLPAERVHTASVQAPPVNGILDYAREVGADLLVIGAHGHGFIGAVLLGSVAQGIVRKAALPTLVIPGTA